MRLSRGRPVVRDEQTSFSGGLNTTADELQLAPNEIRRAENCRLTQVGNLLKRLGTRRLHAAALGAPSVVRGIYSWRPVTAQTLLAISNGVLYTGTYSVGMAWTNQGGTFTAANYPSFAAFRNAAAAEKVYIADGGLLNAWDGAALTMRIAATPSVSQLAVYNQRLFGISGTDQILYWSQLNDGDSLGIAGSGGGSAVVRAFNEQALKGLAALRSSLLLFHTTGVSIFTGLTQDDIAIAAGTAGLTQDTGTIAPRSIVVTENAAYFLSDRGFYVATAAGVVPISQKIDKTVQGFDQTNFDKVCAVHNRMLREIWWYVPDVGVYVFNYFLGAWAGPFTGGYISPVTHSLADAIDSTGKRIVLRGDASGWVSQCDYPASLTDNITSAGVAGSTPVMIAQLKRFFFGDPTALTSFRYFYVQANLGGSNAVSLAWTGNAGAHVAALPASTAGIWGSGGLWGTGTWGGPAERAYRLDANDGGYYSDVTFTDSAPSTCLLSAVQAQGFNMGQRY